MFRLLRLNICWWLNYIEITTVNLSITYFFWYNHFNLLIWGTDWLCTSWSKLPIKWFAATCSWGSNILILISANHAVTTWYLNSKIGLKMNYLENIEFLTLWTGIPQWGQSLESFSNNFWVAFKSFNRFSAAFSSFWYSCFLDSSSSLYFSSFSLSS